MGLWACVDRRSCLGGGGRVARLCRVAWCVMCVVVPRLRPEAVGILYMALSVE